MESQSTLPLWARIVRSDSEAKASFLEWIKFRQQFLLEQVFYRATDMVIVQGARIAHAELASWEHMMMSEEKEDEEYARYLEQTNAN